MTESTLAAVDLGSNSFRLQVARVVDDQVYPLDSLREPVRLAAGVGPDKRLDEASQQRALDCLKRFGERLRGLRRGVGARGRHQYAARGEEREGLSAQGRGGARDFRSRWSPDAKRRG